jgi:hypothetical protein
MQREGGDGTIGPGRSKRKPRGHGRDLGKTGRVLGLARATDR